MRFVTGPKVGGEASQVVSNDGSNNIGYFHLRILGYVPKDTARWILPACILRSLGPSPSLARSGSEYPMLLMYFGDPPISVSKFYDALRAIKEDHFGYEAGLQICDKNGSAIKEHIQTWLPSLNSTPKVFGRNNALCESISKLIQGEVVDECPFDGNSYSSWLAEAHSTFAQYHASNCLRDHLRDLDIFLGGV